MAQEAKTLVRLGTDDLRITNPGLDGDFVDRLASGLKNGTVKPEEVKSLWVRVVPGGSRQPPGGYYVVDGNHTLAALQQAGIKSALAEVYKLED